MKKDQFDGEATTTATTTFQVSHNETKEKVSSLSPVCILSRYKVLCSICADWIQIGQSMFPFTIPASSNSMLCWSHKECSAWFGRKGVPLPPCCRHWNRLGRCPIQEAGEVCAFRHDTVDQQQYSHKKKKLGGARACIRNRHKHSALRIFLIQTYGIEYLQKSFVLDIAGGKGDFSWELVNLIGCPQSVLIDPRGPISTSRMDKLWSKGMFDPKRTGPIFSKWLPAVSLNDYQNKQPKQPKHIRCFFNAPSFLSILQNDEKNNHNDTNNDEDWFQSERSRAQKVQWTTQGLQHEKDNNQVTKKTNTQTNMNQNQRNMMEVTTVKELKDILSQCGLVVGLHPDQATGDIVQFAEHLNIPWCIVPCWYVYLFLNHTLLQSCKHRRSIFERS